MYKPEEVIDRLYPTLKTMKTMMEDVVVIHNRHIIFISDDTKLSVLELPEDTFISICCRFYDIENYMNPKAPGYIGVLAHNYDMPLYYSSLDVYNRYAVCNNCIASVPDFDQVYSDALELKSTDDYKLINVNGIIITFIPGIVKTNKGDSIALDIYYDASTDTYVMRYDLYKKKLKNTISIYMRHFKIV